ncbi:MAG: chemotaxis protein [Hyphomicrobiales bacterium]|nr:MAG: chemotaxis protein [Hyphomicrobiales bacterium]
MSTLSLGFIVEGLVTVLLVLTIGYCIILNRRLKGLHADEEVLKATISELLTATEIAERAIVGLKATASECDRTLGQRFAEAEKMSAEIDARLSDGEAVLKRISEIAQAARPATREQVARREHVAANTDRGETTLGLREEVEVATARLRELRAQKEGRAA